MSAQRCSLVGLVGVTILFCLSPLTAPAQQTKPGDFKINSIRQYTRKAPDYGGTGTTLGGQGGWASEPWWYVEVDFTSEPDFADDVTLRYYVVIGEGRELRMFTGETTHINVKKGRRHYAAMFMHPSTVDRYGQGKVAAVAVQLYHQGRLMDQASDPNARSRWWETMTPTPGFLLKPTRPRGR